MQNSDAPPAIAPWSEATFRVMTSLIFCVAGFGHLFNPAAIIARLESSSMSHLPLAIAPANLHVAAAGVVLLLGGLALLSGFQTRLAALALLAVLVPITVTVQLSPGQSGPLFKNVAIAGALIFFIANGARAYAVDTLLRQRRTRMKPVAIAAA